MIALVHWLHHYMNVSEVILLVGVVAWFWWATRRRGNGDG